AVGAEAGDGDEAVAGTHRAAIEDQARDLQRLRDAGDVGKEFAQGHAAAHWRPPGAGAAATPAAVRGALRARAASCWLACCASQVSMSSGGTSIRRSAPSMTLLNTGADTKPP